MTNLEKRAGFDLFSLGKWAGDDYIRPDSKSAIFWQVPFHSQKTLQQQNPSLQEAWENYLCLLAMTHDNK
jgi:hypothetical protein